MLIEQVESRPAFTSECDITYICICNNMYVVMHEYSILDIPSPTKCVSSLKEKENWIINQFMLTHQYFVKCS